jgi:hypothetical protein
MSIRGVVNAMSTAFRIRRGLVMASTVNAQHTDEYDAIARNQEFDNVIIIPNLNEPITLIYDRRNRMYKLA